MTRIIIGPKMGYSCILLCSFNKNTYTKFNIISYHILLASRFINGTTEGEREEVVVLCLVSIAYSISYFSGRHSL